MSIKRPVKAIVDITPQLSTSSQYHKAVVLFRIGITMVHIIVKRLRL